jgi:hypothetical protein
MESYFLIASLLRKSFGGKILKEGEYIINDASPLFL